MSRRIIIILMAILLQTYQSECCLKANAWFNTGLPLVDLREYNASSKLAEALRDWGFSYIAGHQIPKDIIEKTTSESKIFFNLPARTKRALNASRRTGTKTNRGYTPLRSEQLNARGKRDLKEVLDIGYVDKHASKIQRRQATHYLGNNKWPDEGDLQNATEKYAEHASRVAQTVLDLTAQGLGCASDFKSAFGPDALQVERLTRYPPLREVPDREVGEIGAGIHSDYGGITILYVADSGLSVLKPDRSSSNVFLGTFSPELEVPNRGQWIDVDPIPGTLIVMGGEALQRLSNGYVYAAKHKVDYTGNIPRYSLAFFYDPNPRAILEPLPCFRKNRKPIYKPKIAGHKGVIKAPIKTQ